jgi:hypothetical protein
VEPVVHFRSLESQRLKVGILTYHRLVNRGSVLQAYALQKLLAAQLPDAQVEIVDYSSRKMELLPAWRFVRNRAPVPFDLNEVAELRRMRHFVRHSLRLSTTSLRSDSTGRAMSWLKGLGYDAVVVGSDVVWEVQPRGYSMGGITPYHLPEDTPFTKASFAVSMDPVVDYPVGIRRLLADVAQHINRFDYISVRDDATRAVLVEHGVDAARIRYMPDPTLMVDFEELVEQPSERRTGRPVLAVDLPPGLARQVHPVGRQLGWEVWDWRHLGGNAVDRPLPLGQRVGQVLGEYPGMNVLVTDRFHGSILASRLGGAGVVFVEHSRKWPMPNSKGRDPLRRAGVESCTHRVEGKVLAPAVLAGDVERAVAQADALRDGLTRLAAGPGAEAMASLRQVLVGSPS